MKILFLSNLYPPNVLGGYERLCFAVAEKFSQMGHEISVLTSSYGGEVEDYPNQKIYRTMRLVTDPENIYLPFRGDEDARRTMILANRQEIKAAISRVNPDVIFVWNLYFLGTNLIEQTGSLSPVVFFLTDNWLVSELNPAFLECFFREYVFGNKRDQSLQEPGGILLREWPSKSAPRFFCGNMAIFGSSFTRALYERAGAYFTQAAVVYNGVDLPNASKAVFADRTRFVKTSEIRLLFAGRIVEIKGLHTAIAALPAVIARAAPTTVRLTVVGDLSDREYGERLREVIDRTNTGRCVEFLEPVAEDRLFSLFQEHDIYLFPSLYEPFSLTLIHALGAGIPTVASDVGGNTEIVQDGRTGLLFRRGDSADLARMVTTLLQEPDLRQMLSIQARWIARRFSFSRMTSELLSHLSIVSGIQ